MRNSVILALLVSTFAAFFDLGCGGGGSDDEGWIACAKDEFRLVGPLDGQSIDIRESTLNAGGGMSQLGSPELSTQMVAVDPSRTALDLYGATPINDGETTDARGALRMPNSGALSSESYCLGSGTKLHMSSDGETVQFKLAGISKPYGLTGGNSCATPVAGALQGCWR